MECGHTLDIAKKFFEGISTNKGFKDYIFVQNSEALWFRIKRVSRMKQSSYASKLVSIPLPNASNNF